MGLFLYQFRPAYCQYISVNHYSITSGQKEYMPVCNGLWEGPEMRLLSWVCWLIVFIILSNRELTNPSILFLLIHQKPPTCNHKHTHLACSRPQEPMKNSGDCLMSHSLTLSFMCGETDAIVRTRSPQTEMGCKRTPLNCEVSQWDVQKSFTMLLVSITSAALRSQKSIHQNSPLKR